MAQMRDLLDAFKVTLDKLGKHLGTLNVTSFSGEPKKCKEWVKTLDKLISINSLSDEEAVNLAFRAAEGSVADFISRWKASGNSKLRLKLVRLINQKKA